MGNCKLTSEYQICTTGPQWGQRLPPHISKMSQFLKKTGRSILDGSVIPLAHYILPRLPGWTVLRELEVRTSRECADYVQERMQLALQFVAKRDLLDHALSKSDKNLLVAEFGVWKARSTNHIAKRVSPILVYGFDSFEGLREDWAGWDQPKGGFDLKGRLPPVADNVRLRKGWFDETIPPFLLEQTSAFSFIHIDSDTYESARTVLSLLAQRVVPGTVIVFDEYFGYRGWRMGEFKAWGEFVRTQELRYEYLAFTAQSVAVRVVQK
jgi:Methyltransferase domain